MTEQNIPAEDRAFMDQVITATQGLYAAAGKPNPFAVIKPAQGSVLVLSLPGLASNETQKMHAMNTVRHHSLRLGSPMSALVVEAWSISMGDNTERELVELQRRGKGMGDHPDAFELILIVVESEQGRTTCSLAIDRRHEDMTQLTPNDDLQFDTWDELELKSQGVVQHMAGFHVQLRDRIDPEIIAWAAFMDEKYGDPRNAGDIPTNDNLLLPTTH